MSKKNGRKMYVKTINGSFKLVSPYSRRDRTTKADMDSQPVSKGDLKQAVDMLIWPPKKF